MLLPQKLEMQFSGMGLTLFRGEIKTGYMGQLSGLYLRESEFVMVAFVMVDNFVCQWLHHTMNSWVWLTQQGGMWDAVRVLRSHQVSDQTKFH